MRLTVDLKGLHKTTATLADGTRREYYYAWANGPPMEAQYGTPEFIEEYRRYIKDRYEPDRGSLRWLVANYKAKGMNNLAHKTVKSYLTILDDISKTFGTMPIAAIEEMGSREVFEEWRDAKLSTPRMADLSWTVLRRVFSFSLQKELLRRNPCTGGSGIVLGTRKEIIWTDAEISLMKARAPTHIIQAMVLAYWTGQRQGDLLRLTWAAYDGRHIRLKQSKTGEYVQVLVSDELKAMLDLMKREAMARAKDTGESMPVTILTTEKCKPWGSGFGASWGKAIRSAGVKGKTFHDLRGTFITKAKKSGASIDEICEISGHKRKRAEEILKAHYLASDLGASDAAILKMERAK